MTSVFEDDPFGQIKPDKVSGDAPSPVEVNLIHTKSDVNRSPQAQHHTLGISRNQAASGDHVHDGKTSRKLGHGRGLNVVSSGSDTATIDSILTMLHNVIEFTES